jgi:hypothetical protein
MVDGDAIATSTKLNRVPEKYRLDYAYWVTFTEANGTFEANPDIIWAKYYAFQFPHRKKKQVKEIISAFHDAGLLILWRANEKTWGFFIGSEKPGRLPSSKHLNRYKNLPPAYPGLIPDQSGTDPGPVPLDLNCIELNRIELKRNEGQSICLTDSFPRSEEENDMASSAKRFAERLVRIWHEIHGDSAVVRVSDYSKDEFNFLVTNHKQELLEDAFRLWAQEIGDPRHAYPLSKFLKNAAEYCQRIQPLLALEAKEKERADAQAESVEKETQAIINRREFKPLVNEANINDLE